MVQFNKEHLTHMLFQYKEALKDAEQSNNKASIEIIKIKIHSAEKMLNNLK